VTRIRLAGAVMLTAIAAAAALAPLLVSHSPVQQFADYDNAPPMRPRIVAGGRLVAPYVQPIRLVDRLERRFEPVPGVSVPIRWFAGGVIASVDESAGPWFPLGADALGRDVLARLLYGARLSLAVAIAGSIGALVLGVLVGAPAGFFGGRIEVVLMAIADFVLVLPALYVVLAFRAALPLVLSTGQVFWALTLVLALAGWPTTARGVRSIVSTERRKEYAEAAYAVGGHWLRILLRHLLPAAHSFLGFMGTMMVPAFLVTEGTLTLVGLGFPVPTATWGAMLREAWQSGALSESPWLLSPAAALAATVLAIHMLTAGPSEGPEPTSML
jgi:peptide/nickel transport system permease protein